MPLCRRDNRGESELTLSGTAALKYAVSKAQVWSYPRDAIYDFVRKGANISEQPFSRAEVVRVASLLEGRRLKGDDPVARIARHDVEEVSRELGDVDPSYDPDHLLGLTGDVNAFLEGELDAKALRPLKLSIVERYPHPYEKATAAAWSLSEFESQLLGMPEGVYLRRDQIFPVSAECILGHEYGHAVILDMPNYVPWFDEGLADVLGYAYYSSRFGKVEDLRTWFNYRAEIKQYGRWYEEYDRLVAALLLACGLEGVKALVRLKRYEPRRVKWTRLTNALKANPGFEEVRSCVEGEFPEQSPPPALYAAISRLIGSSTRVYAISPEAYAVILNLMEGRGTKENEVAFRGVRRALRKRVEKELFEHNLVYRHDKKMGIFGGDVLGSEELFASNLVRAEVKASSLRNRL